MLADTYKGPWLHDPGRVFTDLLGEAPVVLDGLVSALAHLYWIVA